ncbi:MAG: hypothetical protein Q9160_001172 [Pyrenula sp. 1 TL-2023]
MVLLTATPAIVSAISSLPQTAEQLNNNDSKIGHVSPSTPSILSSLPRSLDEPISHASLIELSQILSAAFPACSSQYSLHNLLRGTNVYHPPPPPKPQPTAEYLASKEKLVKEQEEREYRRLLQKGHDEPSDGEDADDISPSLVLNILVSVLLCGYAGFWATRFWSNQGLRVLSSMAIGLLVGVAEVVVYAAYLRKAKDAKAKEAEKREIRVLVREAPQGTRSYSEKNAVERDVIWGRGINGGVRRRVQEKWEKRQLENS